MSDISKAPPAKSAKRKSSVNWPVWAAAGILVVFVAGVWVNNYRVSHAAAAAAAIAAKK
jgi:hypothetical protein